MAPPAKNIAILGSTGSIGKSTLEVIAASQGTLRAVALSGHGSVELLESQAIRFRPSRIVATDLESAKSHDFSRLPKETQLLIGAEHISQIASLPEVDVVLSASVGSAGLRGTWAALQAGKTVALANKKALWSAAPGDRSGSGVDAQILPVDSEHWRCSSAAAGGEKKCGGSHRQRGPFRNHTPEQLAHVTVEEALAHPIGRWAQNHRRFGHNDEQGPRNYRSPMAFRLAPEQITVVIPQPIVHSMVEYKDGSVIAQLAGRT